MKSCYALPTESHGGLGGAVPRLFARRFESIFENSRPEPSNSTTAQAIQGRNQLAMNLSFGSGRLRGRQNSGRDVQPINCSAG